MPFNLVTSTWVYSIYHMVKFRAHVCHLYTFATGPDNTSFATQIEFLRCYLDVIFCHIKVTVAILKNFNHVIETLRKNLPAVKNELFT